MTMISPQISSIRAVDAWISIINGYVGRLVRTGFKRTSPNFGGGGALRGRAGATGQVLDFQVPEATMSLSTSVDFSQGPISASDSPLHMAINGPGFFPVLPPNSSEPVLYTRDGEFSLQVAGGGTYVLVNPQGLRLCIPTPTPAPATTTNSNPDSFNIYTDLTNGPLQVLVPDSANEELCFSAYGSTAFELQSVGWGPTYYALHPTDRPKFTNGISSLMTQSLETSNTSINALIPELTWPRRSSRPFRS